MSTIDTIIKDAHTYVESQSLSLNGPDSAEFKIVLGAQFRSVRMQIDNTDDGLDTDAAPMILADIRGGPWSAPQILALSQSLDRAVSRTHAALSPSSGNRGVQTLDNIELFWTDALWEVSLDHKIPRPKRWASIAHFLVSMDLTNPCPKVKQRIIAMCSLGDPWIAQSSANAKTALDEFTRVLAKIRPPAKDCPRAHLTTYPADPVEASAAIEGFADRVYGPSGSPADAPPRSSQDIDNMARDSVLRWTNKSVRSEARSSNFATTLRVPSSAQFRPPSSAHSGVPTLSLEEPPDQQTAMLQTMQQMMQMQQMQMAMMMGMHPGAAGAPSAMGMGGMGGMQPGGGWLPAAGGVRGGPVGFIPGGRVALGGLGQLGRQPPAAAAIGVAPAAIGDAPADDDGDEQVDANGGDEAEQDADDLTTLEQALAAAAPKAKAKAQPKGHAKAAAPEMKRPSASGAMKRPAGAIEPPYWGWELTRKQIMCRTGIPGPNQSQGIKFSVAGSKAKAVKLADEWVARHMKERGLK
jgi:hypothetical protein